MIMTLVNLTFVLKDERSQRCPEPPTVDIRSPVFMFKRWSVPKRVIFPMPPIRIKSAKALAFISPI
jgi:hypothetical protein